MMKINIFSGLTTLFTVSIPLFFTVSTSIYVVENCVKIVHTLITGLCTIDGVVKTEYRPFLRFSMSFIFALFFF